MDDCLWILEFQVHSDGWVLWHMAETLEKAIARAYQYVEEYPHNKHAYHIGLLGVRIRSENGKEIIPLEALL